VELTVTSGYPQVVLTIVEQESALVGLVAVKVPLSPTLANSISLVLQIFLRFGQATRARSLLVKSSELFLVPLSLAMAVMMLETVGWLKP
jgi:hypothetical protein